MISNKVDRHGDAIGIFLDVDIVKLFKLFNRFLNFGLFVYFRNGSIGLSVLDISIDLSGQSINLLLLLILSISVSQWRVLQKLLEFLFALFFLVFLLNQLIDFVIILN